MRARDLWFPIATIGVTAALLATISAADRAHEAQAAVLKTSAAAAPVVTETDGELPDAIWITRETTVAPDQGIPVVEPVPVETEPEVDEKELYMLAHLLAGECQSYSRECQVAVASVVMNRVKHPSYPNSVEGVIFQHGQYACVRDGNYDRKPTALNWEVAEEVLRYGSQIPVNVVFQAQFRQGPCWKKIGSEYFCIIDR